MDPIDPEAEKLFQNTSFGSKKKYIRALRKRRASLYHQKQVMSYHTNLRLASKDTSRMMQINEQIHFLDKELEDNGYTRPI
jgi:hypothetical protein